MFVTYKLQKKAILWRKGIWRSIDCKTTSPFNIWHIRCIREHHLGKLLQVAMYATTHLKRTLWRKNALVAYIATKDVWVIVPIWPTFRFVLDSICIVYRCTFTFACMYSICNMIFYVFICIYLYYMYRTWYEIYIISMYSICNMMFMYFYHQNFR